MLVPIGETPVLLCKNHRPGSIAATWPGVTGKTQISRTHGGFGRSDKSAAPTHFMRGRRIADGDTFAAAFG
ncbi:MAG: hypothetical protein JZU55_09755, partial [Afipia sp.]|nr:hypothetical protein [Afipia sp.]